MNSKYFKIGIFLGAIFLLFRWCSGGGERLHSSALPKDAPRVIVAFGDSLTEGYELPSPETQSYPALLERKLIAEGYINSEVINMGISGDTTQGGVNRLNDVLEEDPNIVILALGANDGLRKVPLHETEENLRNLITAFQEKEIEVLLVGMKFPFLVGALGYTPDYKKMYKQLSKDYDLVLVPSILEGVLNKTELNLEDGKHPNAKGYKIVVENVWEGLKKLL